MAQNPGRHPGVHAADPGLIKEGKNQKHLENQHLGAVTLGWATQHHLPQHPEGEGNNGLQRPSQPKTVSGTAPAFQSLALHPCREPLGAARGDDAQRKSELPPRHSAGTNCENQGRPSIYFFFILFDFLKNYCLKVHLFLYFKVSKALCYYFPVSVAERTPRLAAASPGSRCLQKGREGQESFI